MYRIMIIEDDPTIAEMVSNGLKSWGYNTYITKNFNDILSEFTEFSPELILLDISLPFFNGYYWCTEIRKISKVPIMFMSSSSDNMNIVMAMNMGGDDFIAKPFSMDVLMAKVQALLRRTYNFSGETSVIQASNAILNLNDNTLLYNGNKIELSKNEYRILQTLMNDKGKIISRETIMEKLWETDCFVDDNTLTVNITRLRKKLEGYGLCNFIITKKGTGYMVE